MCYFAGVLPDSYAEPIALFEHYFVLAQAQTGEPHDATAVALGTADAEGRPSVRMVLLKGLEAGHFVFFTSYLSRKAQQLEANPHAALCFYWPTIAIQVRAEGAISKLDAAASDAYFATRPRGSQLAAWTSEQSAPLADRADLLRRYEEIERRYAEPEQQAVPRPRFWGGYRLLPERIEFWHSEPYRMHDRLLFIAEENGAWRRTRLFP